MTQTQVHTDLHSQSQTII